MRTTFVLSSLYSESLESLSLYLEEGLVRVEKFGNTDSWYRNKSQKSRTQGI